MTANPAVRRPEIRRLGAPVFRDATVLHTNRPMFGPMKGGAVDSEGAVIPSSQLNRSYGTAIGAPDEIPAAEHHLPGTYIFGGYLLDHFGHFLLEGCARLWHARPERGTPIIWSFSHGELKPFQREILRLIGVRNDHAFIDRPTSVDSLIVPEPAYVIQDFCHPRFIRLMGRTPVDPHGKNVWLSRSGLPAHLSGVEGEVEIEANLARAGWVILHPQLHSLVDQVRIIGGAAHVAGFAGSAFHNLLLTMTFNGQVTIFARGHAVTQNFQTIADAKGIRQRIVTVQMEKVEDRGPRSVFRLGDPRAVLDRLNRTASASVHGR